MDPIFSLYVNRWLDASLEKKMARISDLYRTGHLLVERSVDERGQSLMSSRQLQIEVARRMYAGSAQTQHLIDIVAERSKGRS